ncbi:hypothetical protein V8C86DRAFT_2721374 [Haematococcus lacustris]
MYVSFKLVLIAIVASWATVSQAGDATGSGFPYFDNCRRSLSETRFDVRLTSEAVNPVNGSVFCWTVYVKPATACLSPQRRCCSTSFAKVKLYTNQLCNRSFSVMQVTAPLINFNVTASVSQDNVCSAQSITNCVKFTQFGPIPQSGANGTTLCMRMRSAREGGVCHTLQQITNPVLANRSLFELGIYDRKVDNYECCPTFAYNLGGSMAPAPTPLLTSPLQPLPFPPPPPPPTLPLQSQPLPPSSPPPKSPPRPRLRSPPPLPPLLSSPPPMLPPPPSPEPPPPLFPFSPPPAPRPPPFPPVAPGAYWNILSALQCS